MKKLLSMVLTLTMLLSFCAFARAEADSTDDWYLEADGQIVVILEGNPTTGYEWTAETSDPEITDILTLDYIPNDADADAVGVGGVYIGSVATSGKKTGSCVVTFTYARSWEEEADKVYTLYVETCEGGLMVAGSGMTGNIDFDTEEEEFIPFFQQDEEGGDLTISLFTDETGAYQWIWAASVPGIVEAVSEERDGILEIVFSPAEGAEGAADLLFMLTDLGGMDITEVKLIHVSVSGGFLNFEAAIETVTISAIEDFGEEEDYEEDWPETGNSDGEVVDDLNALDMLAGLFGEFLNALSESK